MKASHPYAVGVAFIAVGLLITIGGVSGNLAPMIGALFAPSYVGSGSSKNVVQTNKGLNLPSQVKIGGVTIGHLTGPLSPLIGGL